MIFHMKRRILRSLKTTRGEYTMAKQIKRTATHTAASRARAASKSGAAEDAAR
jgi:hypothetical protein